MQYCPTLRKVLKNYVDFDVKNPEHLEAFKSLCLEHYAKQHPTLRFNLTETFEDVRSMMFHQVGQAYLKRVS